MPLNAGKLSANMNLTSKDSNSPRHPRHYTTLGLQTLDRSIARPPISHAVVPAQGLEYEHILRTSPTPRYVEVRPSPGKGLGLFASRHIPAGTRFTSEPPLIALKSGEDAPELFEKFMNLTEPVQNHVKSFTSRPPQRQAEMKQKLARRGYRPDQVRVILEIVSIFQANAFKLEGGHMMFPLTARINHSCLPNAHTNFNSGSNLMHTHALQDIKQGAEIEISYWNMSMSRDDRQSASASRGFRCNCCVCDLRDARQNDLEQIRRRTREVIHVRNRLSFGLTGTPDCYRKVLQNAYGVLQMIKGQGYCDPSLPELYHILALTKEEITPLQTRRAEFHKEILGHYDSALQAESLMTGEDSESTEKWRSLFEEYKEQYYTIFPVEASLDTKY